MKKRNRRQNNQRTKKKGYDYLKKSPSTKTSPLPIRRIIAFVVVTISATLITNLINSRFFSDDQTKTLENSTLTNTNTHQILDLLKSQDSLKTWNTLSKKATKLNELVKNFDSNYQEETAFEMSRILNEIVIGEGISLSILDQLKIKELMSYVNSSKTYEPMEPNAFWQSTFTGLFYLHGNMGEKDEGMRYITRIQEGFVKNLVSYDLWSQSPILDDYQGGKFNRLELIMAVSYLGAGIPTTNFYSTAYKKLASANYTGWVMGDGKGKEIKETKNRADLVSIRAISEEFLLSYTKLRYDLQRVKREKKSI